MATLRKQGLDFFPLDTHWDSDLMRFFLSHGAEGVGYYILLLRAIYANGYYLDADMAIIAHALGVTQEIAQLWVDRCIDAGLIDKDRYMGNKIVTSSGIQKRWLFASARRSEKNIRQEYNLIS
jgi:hypothetical protein